MTSAFAGHEMNWLYSACHCSIWTGRTWLLQRPVGEPCPVWPKAKGRGVPCPTALALACTHPPLALISAAAWRTDRERRGKEKEKEDRPSFNDRLTRRPCGGGGVGACGYHGNGELLAKWHPSPHLSAVAVAREPATTSSHRVSSADWVTRDEPVLLRDQGKRRSSHPSGNASLSRQLIAVALKALLNTFTDFTGLKVNYSKFIRAPAMGT